MAHPALVLCSPRLAHAAFGDDTHVVPRPIEPLLAEADAVPLRSGWVELTGACPGLHPELERVVGRLANRGLRVRLITDERGLDPDRLARLVGLGVGVLRLPWLSADDAVHDALVGRPGARAGLVALADATRGLSVKLELLTTVLGLSPDAATSLMGEAVTRGVELHLQPAPTGRGPAPDALLRVLDSLREDADRSGADLRPEGFVRAPQAARAAAPTPAGPALWRFLRAGIPLPHAGGGCVLDPVPPEARATLGALAGGEAELGHALAAWGCPPLDRSPAEGGPGAHVAGEPLPAWTPSPGRRVLLINPAMADKVMTQTTLRALQSALESLGAEVRVVSAWGDPTPEEQEEARRQPGALEAARTREAALLATLSLDDVDLVVVPSLVAGLALLRGRPLPPGLRVVVADFHLMEGLADWQRAFVAPGATSRSGGWWPSDQVQLVSCFPCFAGLYRTSGVPLRQVSWRPYPVQPLGDGAPAERSRRAFSGGNHLRDWSTLAQAAARLPADLPLTIDLYTKHSPPGGLPAALDWKGTVDLSVFRARLAESRFVVVPVPFDPLKASGITVAALALAAGRPVLASRTPSLQDHVRHGVNGWLVDPGDPTKLAQAIQRLAVDDNLIAHLAAGARASAQIQSATAWAHELLHGAEPVRVWGQPGGPWRPWAPAEPPVDDGR